MQQVTCLRKGGAPQRGCILGLNLMYTLPFSNYSTFMQIKQLLLTEPVAWHKDYAWSSPQEMEGNLYINLQRVEKA